MYDDAKNEVRTEALGHLTDIFELCYTECFSQGADHARIFSPGIMKPLLEARNAVSPDRSTRALS